MKKHLIFASLLLSSILSVAQTADDPVVMTVAGVDVPRSEFEYSYNKNNTDGVIDKKSVEEYVELFINYKLKVRAAQDQRIDTTTAFKTEFAQYRDQQIRPTFVTDADMLEEAHKVYDDYVQRVGADGLVRASHILVLVPQKATKEQQEAAKVRIDSIYDALKAGADFAALARKVSQCPSAAKGGDLNWFARKQMVKEFEDAAFALQKGEMSKPVLSPFGWHIILLTDRKQVEPFEFHQSSIMRFLEQRGVRDHITDQKLTALANQSNGTLTDCCSMK